MPPNRWASLTCLSLTHVCTYICTFVPHLFSAQRKAKHLKFSRGMKINLNFRHDHAEASMSYGYILPYYTRREGAILQSPCPSVHTFVTDISASTGRNDFIFDIWLWHGDLYCVSPFQVYRTSTSCLQCDLEFFMFAVMKTFVTVISASTGRNDFIFDIWLWHGDLYRVSPFQVYRTSTSCLPCDLEFFMFAVLKTFVTVYRATYKRTSGGILSTT